MLSQRNRWLLVAVPIALLLIWAALQSSSADEDGSGEAAAALSRGLIYLSPASGAAKLFHIDVATNSVEALGSAENVSAFDLQSDGSQLVYAAANALGGSDLWQMALDSRQSAVLLDCGGDFCGNPKYSADGTMLAYELDFSEIWLLHIGSGESEQISPSGQVSFGAAWSEDGQVAYFNQSAQRYEVVMAGSTSAVSYANNAGEALSWAADGDGFVAAEFFAIEQTAVFKETATALGQVPTATAIATEAEEDVAEVTAVASATSAPLSSERIVSRLMRYEAGEAGELFEVGDNFVEDSSPTYSPDGDWLAFTRRYLDEARWTLGRQLWLYDLESGLALAYSDAANFHISGLAWSGDSEQIAFVRSNRVVLNEPLELWVIDVDGSGARLMVVDAFAAQWTP